MIIIDIVAINVNIMMKIWIVMKEGYKYHTMEDMETVKYLTSLWIDSYGIRTKFPISIDMDKVLIGAKLAEFFPKDSF
jgi:hypothetical protein